VLEARCLLSASVPATSTDLSISTTPVGDNVAYTLTANVHNLTSDATPVGTVAFVYLGSWMGADGIFRDPATGQFTDARLLGTASVSSDGTAVLDHVELLSGKYRVEAIYLGVTPTLLSLPNASTVVQGDAYNGQYELNNDINIPYYIVFPNGKPIEFVGTQYFQFLDSAPANGVVLPDDGMTVSRQLVFGLPYVPNQNPAPQDILSGSDAVRIDPPVLHSVQTSDTYTYQMQPFPLTYQPGNPSFDTSASSVQAVNVSLATSIRTALLLQNLGGSTPTNPPIIAAAISGPDFNNYIFRGLPYAPPHGDIHSATTTLTIHDIANAPSPSSGGDTSHQRSTLLTSVSPLIEQMPAGDVTFYKDNTPLARIPLSGDALWRPSADLFPLGTYTIRAVYSGDDIYLPGSGQFTLTITHTPTSLTIIPSTTTIHPGGTISLTTTVSTAVPDNVTPTGPVVFSEGGQNLATSDLGSTSEIIVSLAPGQHTLTATYAGDSDCLSSVALVTLTVAPEPSLPAPVNPDPPTVIPTSPSVNPGPGTVVTAPSPTTLTWPSLWTWPTPAITLTLALVPKTQRVNQPFSITPILLHSAVVPDGQAYIYADHHLIAKVRPGAMLNLGKLIHPGKHAIQGFYYPTKAKKPSLNSAIYTFNITTNGLVLTKTSK
jgi:hypothetical protein